MTEFNPESPEPIVPKTSVRKKKRWRAILLGLIILASGVLLGAGVTAVYVHKMVHIIQTPGEAPKRITNRLRWKLNLSDQQAERIQAIFVEREKALTAIFHEISPRLREQVKRTREEVSAVLNPDQAKTWNRHFDRMQRRWFPGMMRERGRDQR